MSTLRKADRLVVLDRGKIVEVGNHDALMAREGAYYTLYQAQQRNVDTDIDAALETVEAAAVLAAVTAAPAQPLSAN